MTKLNHTVNLALTAGIIVYDDRGACVRTIRLPYMTLFFWLPALAYGWLTGAHLPPVRWPAWVLEVGEAAAWLWEVYFTGGAYWKLVMG